MKILFINKGHIAHSILSQKEAKRKGGENERGGRRKEGMGIFTMLLTA